TRPWFLPLFKSSRTILRMKCDGCVSAAPVAAPAPSLDALVSTCSFSSGNSEIVSQTKRIYNASLTAFYSPVSLPHGSSPHPLCAQSDRLSAHRRRAHRAVQLSFCPPHRRQIHPAHRGYRPRALHAAGDSGDPGRDAVARARLRRRAVLSDRAFSALQGKSPRAARSGESLSVRVLARRARRQAPGGAERKAQADVRRHLPAG